MAFSSHIFVFYFLPLFLLLYYLLPSKSNLPRNVLLLVAGYAFYAWASPWFVVVLVGSTVVTYVLSKVAVSAANRNVQTALLVIAIAANLGVLGVFKYYSFVQSNLNCLLKIAGDSTELPVLALALPVGLSFYSLKAISYSIDVYRGSSPPALSFLDLALYTSFFPQVLAGPIQRFGTIDPKSQQVPTFAEQLGSRKCTLDKFAQGSALFIAGFAKKVLLADTLAGLADAVFTAESPGASDAWFGAVAYSFQLYFDFSGYSEMAVGLGLMLGFECPRNFNAPYLVRSITDFWRRWHISLSSWFRDYLYIPLGGNRKSPARTYLNLAVVFLICGLWHGANWTFIVWGAYHGLLLISERASGKRTIYNALPRPIQVFITFGLLTVGWVFFRSADLGDACRLLGTMLGASASHGGSTLLSGEIYTRGNLIAMGVCALLVFQPVQAFDWSRRLTYLKVLILIALFCLSLMVMFTKSFNSFLYFQF
jgi:alginate O-acetyltransferase complex protein AlgI